MNDKIIVPTKEIFDTVPDDFKKLMVSVTLQWFNLWIELNPHLVEWYAPELSVIKIVLEKVMNGEEI